MGSDFKIDVEIVKKVLKYNNNSENVRIMLNNGECFLGIITRFDGSTIEVSGDEKRVISIFEVKDIDKDNSIDFAPFLGQRVSVHYSINSTDVVKDGVVVSIDDKISIVTEEGVLSVNQSDIIDISRGEAIVAERSELDGGNENLSEKIIINDKKIDEPKETIEEVPIKIADTVRKTPDAIEKAIIDGKHGTLNQLLKNPEKLEELGYSEKEIDRIEKNIKGAWTQDDYSIASRLYSMIVNRDRLAEKYYLKVVETANSDSEEFAKSINVLSTIIISRTPNEIVDFYEKFATSATFDDRFCIEYIIAKLQVLGKALNSFELSIIRARKNDVGNYIGSSRRLIELGYSESDIDRFGKAYETVSWETTLYKSATRVFAMVLNRNGIAESLYELALLSEPENIKIINALASIKATGNKDSFIAFFERYEGKLRRNPNYCNAYASAVIATRDLKTIEKRIKRISSLLADMPELLNKYESEIQYIRDNANFSLENVAKLSERMKSLDISDDSQSKEHTLLMRLPEKDAVLSILTLYAYQEQYDLFCEVFILFADYVRTNITVMDSLRKALKNCSDNYVIKLLPNIPILWCEEGIAKRYKGACERLSVVSTNRKASRLKKVLDIVENYPTPNQFEMAIVENDFATVNAFIDDPQDLLLRGYEADEIHDISMIDMDEYQNQAESSYEMKNIISFQGNKNHFAERFIFDAYFANKLDMCTRLFPLLLEEKRGELILELFEYDADLQEKLSSGKRFYYLALCYGEDNDEVFRTELSDKWKECPEKDVLTRLLGIAEKAGDTILINQLKRHEKKYSRNEFEIAVINADNDVIRKFVKNAELLVNLGYTPGEIQRISSIFASSTTNMGSTTNQIAQRVYLYQKNKNGLAESLFWEVLSERKSAEEERIASTFLFQINAAQRNYTVICDLYKKYLHKEMTPKFNEVYASSYANALFSLEKYADFIEYYHENKSDWQNFSLYSLLLYAEEKMGYETVEPELWMNVLSSKYKPDIIGDYICLLFEKGETSKYNQYLVPVFNKYLPLFSVSDLTKIKEAIRLSSIERWNTPEAYGVLLMCESEDNGNRLIEWMRYLRGEYAIAERCSIFLHMSEVVCVSKYILVQSAFELCEEAVSSGENVDAIDAVISFIIQAEIDGNSQSRLLSVLERILDKTPNELGIIRSAWKLSLTLGISGEFYRIIEKIDPSSYKSKSEIDDYARLLIDFYRTSKEQISTDQRENVISQILKCAEHTRLSRDELVEINSFFEEKSLQNYSSIIEMILVSYTEESEEKPENTNESDGKFFDGLINILNLKENILFSEYIGGWRNYFSLSQMDIDILEKLSSTVSASGKWLREEINILAKALFVEPDNDNYWKMIYKWFEIQIGIPSRVIGNLFRQMRFEDGHSLEKAIQVAIEKGQNEIAVSLILQMMRDYKDYNISGQKLIRQIINREEVTNNEIKKCGQDLIRIIFEDFESTDVFNAKWNSVCAALDIAKASGGLKLFLQLFSKYMSGEYVKQCSVVLAEALSGNETEIIEPAKELMVKSYTVVPFKQLLLDKVDKYHNGGIDDDDKVLLRLITKDYGNNLGINDYFEFYCEMMLSGKKEQGIRVIKSLQVYFPNDFVLYEILASFVCCPENEEERVQLYLSLYRYFDECQREDVVEYAVGRMICGEKYFKLQGDKVPSFYELTELHYPKLIEIAKKYGELCDGIQMMLENTQYDKFALIIFRALFTCDWQEVFDYDIDEQLFNDLIRNTYSERINVIDDYHRSFIKSVMMFLLRKQDKVTERYARIEKMWNQLKVAGCSFASFMSCCEGIDNAYKEEIENIWSLDIETITIFKQFWGKYIVQQKNCEKYTNIFGVFSNGWGNEIFTKKVIEDSFTKMPTDRAIEIATCYEALFVRPIGFVNLIQTHKKALKGSNYEKNVFSEFLKKVNPKYNELDERCERYKRKYNFLCQMYNVKTFSGEYCEKLSVEEKRALYSLRALWLYYYVLAKDERSTEIPSLVSSDYINTLTVVYGDDTHLEYLDQFLDNFPVEYIQVAGVVMYICTGNLEAAFNAIPLIQDWDMRGRLAQRIVAAYGKQARDNEVVKKCWYYVKPVSNEKNYWIKNNTVGEILLSKNPEEYINASEENSTTTELIDRIVESVFGTGKDNLSENYDVQREDESAFDKDDEQILITDGEMMENDSDEIDSDEIDSDEIDSESEIILSYEQIIDDEECDEDNFEDAIDDELRISYLDQFFDINSDDKEIVNLKKRITSLQKESDETKKKELNYAVFEAGVYLLGFNGANVNRSLFAEVCGMIEEDSIKKGRTLSSILGVFDRYICGFTSIEDLCTSFSEIKKQLMTLTLPQTKVNDTNQRIQEDLDAVSDEIKLYSEITLDVQTITDEERLAQSLIKWQTKLDKKNNPASRSNFMHVKSLMRNKVDRLLKRAKLTILHEETSEENDWEEIWSKDVKKGMVRGIVKNSGAADARDVNLSVSINGVPRREYYIDSIGTNEVIPFAVSVNDQDIQNGRISWNASLSYKNNNSVMRAEGNGSISIMQDDNDWDPRLTGKELFVTERAAEGEEFCGRHVEMATLMSLYDENSEAYKYPSLLVTGLRRTGKSSVIKRFCKLLKGREDVIPIYVDGQSSGRAYKAFIKTVMDDYLDEDGKDYVGKELIQGNYSDFYEKWIKISDDEFWYEELPTFYRDLSRLLGGRKIIYILDEMESVFYSGYLGTAQTEERFFGVLRAIIQNYQMFVSFVFCGSDRLLSSCLDQKRESQLFQVLQRICIGRMSIQEIRSIFERYNNVHDTKFTDESINGIMKYTGGQVWYTTSIAFKVLEKIVDRDRISYPSIHLYDVDSVVEMMIEGDLGNDYFDLIDNNFGAKRKAIARAMARCTHEANGSVSVDMICSELEKMNYVDSESGESLSSLSEKEVLDNLKILEKMDFVKKDVQHEKSFQFAIELYRLFMLEEKKIKKFVIKRVE